MKGGRALATLGGMAMFGAHVAALPWLVEKCQQDELSVRLIGAPAAERFDLDGEVPVSLSSDVGMRVDGGHRTAFLSPGLHHATWTVSYRGGFTRSVGAAQLTGPFQDPAQPTCGGRLVVGQSLLDDGHAGEGTIASMVAQGIAYQMSDFDQFPIGEFEKVSGVEVRWARFDDTPEDKALFGQLRPDAATVFGKTRHTDGYARVKVVVELTRINATVVVAMVPKIKDGRLELELYTRAHISSGNDYLDWALDKFDVDGYATKAVREQIDGALLSAFDPPPPLELPGGRTLRFEYCAGAHLAMVSGQWAALPLALHIEGPAGQDRVLPPRLGPVTPPPPTPGAAITFDLDLDTINALLFELWRTGFLDEQLAAAKLDERFAADPTVRELLSLRISPLRLALPPVVSPGPRGLRMAADLRVDLIDGKTRTPARVWGALDVILGGGPLPAKPASHQMTGLPRTQSAQVGVAELELACEPEPRLLRPCYGDLVSAMRARAADARGPLSGVLAKIIDELFTGRRVSAPDTPAELVLGAPQTTTRISGPSATIRIEMPAKLEPLPL